MISDFFTFGNRKYINNAVVTADIFNNIHNEYGNVTNFKIHFKKPFFSQANLIIDIIPQDGYFIGSFISANITYYFSYLTNNILF